LQDNSAFCQPTPFRDANSMMAIAENIGVFTNPDHKLWIAPVPDTEPVKAGPGEVELEVIATGICGSDVHFWQHGAIGPMVVEDTHLLGHESSALVTAVHPSVTSVKVGDKVAIEPGIPCGECKECLRGRYNGCTNVKFFSTPPFHGLLRRRLVYPARWCHNINGLSYEEGALLEPLSVALAGIERADVNLGDPVLICGAGPIGVMSLLCAKAAGACPIVVTDLAKGRLDFVKELVPSVHTLQIERSFTPEQIGEKIEAMLGIRPRVAIECTGVASSLAAAVWSVQFSGVVFCIGVGASTQNIPFMRLSTQEIDLRFQYRYANTWPRAVRLVREKVIDVKKLVTGRWRLEDALDAFEATKRGEGIKCMIFSRPEDV